MHTVSRIFEFAYSFLFFTTRCPKRTRRARQSAFEHLNLSLKLCALERCVFREDRQRAA